MLSQYCVMLSLVVLGDAVEVSKRRSERGLLVGVVLALCEYCLALMLEREDGRGRLTPRTLER
jgi:hypothetical protein